MVQPPAQADPIGPQGNYAAFVRSATAAAITLLAVKLAAELIPVLAQGVNVRIGTWGHILPRLELDMRPDAFADLLATSTLAMAVTATAALALTLCLTRFPPAITAGWCLGPPITLLTQLAELARDDMAGPCTAQPQLAWTLYTSGTGILLALLWLASLRRPASQP
ncbi:hypothetical protein DRB96_11100 [Streptomyces sp. ICC1]|nr:hypothetical protein DRB89_12065 [Streptomyces sp. ICC4]AWZ12785.1 hypothetical protein DRB96_11100 [Streptomyces sp. ICC1]